MKRPSKESLRTLTERLVCVENELNWPELLLGTASVTVSSGYIFKTIKRIGTHNASLKGYLPKDLTQRIDNVYLKLSALQFSIENSPTVFFYSILLSDLVLLATQLSELRMEQADHP